MWHVGGRSRRLLIGVVAIAVILLGAFLAVRSSPDSTAHPSAHRTTASPPATFLAVSTTPPRERGQYFVKWPVSTLQLRSVHGGRLITTLLRSLGSIDAVDVPGGSVIAVVSYGCRAQVWRINPRPDARTLVRTIPQSAQDVALSPDGNKLAYLTYPASGHQQCGPSRQLARPVRFHDLPDLASFLPNVVAVINLKSGAVARTATRNPGNPPFSLAWSPSGSQIATVVSGGIDLLSAVHPDFGTSKPIRPRRGCGYRTATWTVRGILAVENCGTVNPAVPQRILKLLAPAGRQPSSWQLPACTEGVGLIPDPALRHVLVWAEIGYGSRKPCGVNWTYRLAEVLPSHLKTVAVQHNKNQSYLWGVTGW